MSKKKRRSAGELLGSLGVLGIERRLAALGVADLVESGVVVRLGGVVARDGPEYGAGAM